jgi:hypothetical protein
MATRIRKQWLDLTYSPTGLTSTDITYTDTTTIKLAIDDLYNKISNYTLTITKAGNGTGTVTSFPSGINCGVICSYQFLFGTSVTLTATPDSGSAFGGWSGDVTDSSSTIIVIMDSNKSMTSTFNLSYTLTVTETGTGTGTVTSSPSGINCGATCTYQFAPGTSVTLTAIPDSSSIFSGWTGAATGTDTTVTVTMNSDKHVYAVFNVFNAAGYFAGGMDTSARHFIDKLLFSDESRLTLGDSLTNDAYYQSAGNSSLAGYFAGGYGNGYYNLIDRILFNSDSRTTLTAKLSQTSACQSACNSTLAGYFAGGYYYNGNTYYYSFIDKLLFSNESRSTLTSTLSRSIVEQSACNSTLAGYFACGAIGNTNQSFIDKLLFSDEPLFRLTAILSHSVYSPSACNSSLAGYFSGGYGGNYQNFIDKLLFNDESRSTLAATLSQSVGYQSACNSTLAGYFAGGSSGGSYQSFIDKLLFNNESRSTLTTTLSQSIYRQSACQSGGIL